MEVVLKFARINPWAGIAKYKDCFDYIGTYLTRAGNCYTGLTEEDARRLEKAMGYTEGYLSPNSAFWKTYTIKLGAKDHILHTERPEDELAYLFLKKHKRVSLGLASIKPHNDYVLVNTDAEAEEANRLNKIKREAYTEFNKMSIEEMRKCLRIYGHKSDNNSNELIESKLFSLIEADPKKYFLLWVDNKNKEMQYVLETAISKNVVRKNKNVYYYGTDVIGRSQEDTISFLNDKTNQEIKMAILQAIETK